MFWVALPWLLALNTLAQADTTRSFYGANKLKPLVTLDSSGDNNIYLYAHGKRIAVVADDTSAYYHQDHIQSTRLVTQDSGSVVASLSYTAYGGAEVDVDQLTIDYRFSDQLFDHETGLYSFHERLYAPEHAVFTSIDPLGASISPYSAFNNNPINYIDSDGAAPFSFDLLARSFSSVTRNAMSSGILATNRISQFHRPVRFFDGQGGRSDFARPFNRQFSADSRGTKGHSISGLEATESPAQRVLDRIGRLKALQKTVNDGQYRRTTFAVAEVKMPDGSIQTMVSSAGKDGKVRGAFRETGDKPVRNKIKGVNKESGSRLNDAEQTIFREAEKLGGEILAWGATSKVCKDCQAEATKKGIIDKAVTPLER